MSMENIMDVSNEAPNEIRRKKKRAVPHGASIVAHVMEQMQLMGDMRLKAAAHVAGMNHQRFSLIRKLLMLKTWDTVSTDERTVILTALHMIDKEKKFPQALALVNGILKKHWYAKSRDGRRPPKPDIKVSRHQSYLNGKPKREATRVLRKNIKKLDSTLFAIREACTNNDELEIPQLDETVRRECVDVLDDAIHALMELRRKIRESANERS